MLLPHSIQKPGRGPFSYTPGQPLADFRVSFDRAPGKNQAVEVAGGAYRLRQSRCFLQSAGKLRCTTCHDPHNIPRGPDAAAHYNQVCAACHAAPAGPGHTAAADCVGCHMPKTRTDDAVHIVVTDHFIQRRPPAADLLAEKPETHESPATSYRGPVVPYYPGKVDPLDDAVAQVRDGSNLRAGLPRLAALIDRLKPTAPRYYVDLGEAWRAAGDSPKAIHSFDDALTRSPDSLVILLKLGNALIEAREWARAETVLRRATVRAPADPLAWGLLGWTLWQQDKRVEACTALEKAIRLDPEIPELHNYLGSLFAGTGDRAGAEREFRAAVRIEPGIAEWRANLAGLLASLGQVPEARYHFTQSIRFKPTYAAARFDYAQVLAAVGDMPEAEKQAQAAVEADPARAGAHELWGALLANHGDLPGAARELQLAVKLQPALGKAQFELGMVLSLQGDTAGAIEHLRIAARNADPASKAAADEALKKLGK
jgi:predicted CXXCH cytochrome family protein